MDPCVILNFLNCFDCTDHPGRVPIRDGGESMQGTISEEVLQGFTATQPGQELQNNVHDFLSSA